MPYKDPARQKAAQQAHYEANKAKYLERSKQSKARNVAQKESYVQDVLCTTACQDCGENDPVVLEFDHRDGRETKNASSPLRLAHYGASWEKIKQEIALCDVVCANCHTRRTAQRAGWPRLLLRARQRELAS